MSSWAISVEEFTERHSPSTRRPLSAALSASLIVHSACLSAVLLWVDFERDANRAQPQPVFDIALSRATAARDSGRSDSFNAATEAPLAEQVALPDIQAPPQPAPPNTASEAPMAEMEKTEPEAPRPLALESATLEPAQLSQHVIDRTVATPTESAWQVALAAPLPEPAPRPDIQQMPLTATEQTVLEEQLREWQDDFELLREPNQSVSWQQGKQIFHATVEQRAPQNNTDLERAIVEISTEVDGVRMSTQMAFKRLAFSNYAQVVDRWDRDVAVSDDEIYGRFHSNSRVTVSPQRRSEPVFGGKVTIASSIRMNGFARRADIFVGGLETRVTPIELPEQFAIRPLDFAEVPEHPISDYHFTEDGQIRFLAGGGFEWRDEYGSQQFDCAQHCYIQAGDNVQLDVEGTVNGTILIVAEDTISITGDLVYQRHPAQFADSQDFLGILSENYIEIAPPSVTGSGDLTIHGALYAKRRFVVRTFRNRNRGLLSLFGSLTAGSLSATEPRYATRIDFDPRFEQRRPPHFPMTDKYELEGWDRQWSVQEKPSVTGGQRSELNRKSTVKSQE